jgi:hypothetical protein
MALLTAASIKAKLCCRISTLDKICAIECARFFPATPGSASQASNRIQIIFKSQFVRETMRTIAV